MSEKFKYIGSSYLFLIEDGKILLMRRANTGFMDEMYGVPSGHLDGNESAREGCAREVKEEIGIDIKPDDLEVVHVMHRKMDDERIDFFMTTKSYTGEITNCEPEKCDELSWWPLSALPKNTIDYVRVALDGYQEGQTYSEYGYK